MVWSLKEKDVELKPLIFSNGKDQNDIVNEVLKAISDGNRIIFVHGACGTGKSAIALNIAKHFDKTSIVVPIKNLQRQYEQDYSGKKHVLKSEGRKLKIKVITGRNNHICPFLKENELMKQEKNSRLNFFLTPADKLVEENPNLSCDNKFLPCTIEVKEKNFKKIRDYVRKNPNVRIRELQTLKGVKRMTIAPICPYWSPIAPASVELNLKADKKKYIGLNNEEFNFYRRKPGCGYYDQFDSYIDADVLIFNSQKYMLENAMNRKPQTDIDVIDECDEFLDNFSEYENINLNRLTFSLIGLYAEKESLQRIITEIGVLASEMMRNPKVQENIANGEIILLKQTPLMELMKLFLENDLMSSVECDENNYCYHCDKVARLFQNFKEDAYVSFAREGKDVVARIVTINLEKRFQELINKNKIFVLMSGTLHSDRVLKEVFGIKDFKVIEAESKPLGTITMLKTGKEINCSYDNFKTGRVNRMQYLLALNECILRSKKPTLVHVTSFNDLPTKDEKEMLSLDLISQEKLRNLQENSDSLVRQFKNKELEILYTTRCNRGIDFPGEMCNSIVLTRYPYPNVSSIFWKLLKRNKPEHYNSFYLDKARRDFMQKIYRGLRSHTDHVYLLSPDIRVFENLKV
jgi:Rad3-related DNA helicase